MTSEKGEGRWEKTKQSGKSADRERETALSQNSLGLKLGRENEERTARTNWIIALQMSTLHR